MGNHTRAAVLAFVLASAGAAAHTPVAHHRVTVERLIQAVRHDRIDLVQRWVQGGGVGVDAALPGDGTALIVAAGRGDLGMVDALLELGADANHSARGDGNPLIAASAGGHLDVMARLLAAGAQVDTVVPDDETALITAVRNDRLQAVEFLVERGADVNLGVLADGSRWRSPLNQARSPAVRTYLLGKGAMAGGPRRVRPRGRG